MESEQVCPQCDTVIHLHAADGSPRPLTPNAVFVCLTCRTVNVVQPDGVPRRPGDDELMKLLARPLVQRAIAAAAHAHRERPS